MLLALAITPHATTTPKQCQEPNPQQKLITILFITSE
jgi:hypothetical protein